MSISQAEIANTLEDDGIRLRQKRERPSETHDFADYLGSLFSSMLGERSYRDFDEDAKFEEILNGAPHLWKTSGFLNDLKLFSGFVRISDSVDYADYTDSANLCYSCHQRCGTLYNFQFCRPCDNYSAWCDSDNFLQNAWPSEFFPLPLMKTQLPQSQLEDDTIIQLGPLCAKQAKAYHWFIHLKAETVNDLAGTLMWHHVSNGREFDEWAKTKEGYNFCEKKSRIWNSIQDRIYCVQNLK